MLALRVIPESGLVQEDLHMTPLHVEMQRRAGEIMRRDPLKLWDTSWCSEDVNSNRAKITQMKSKALNNKDKQTNKQNKKPGK